MTHSEKEKNDLSSPKKKFLRGRLETQTAIDLDKKGLIQGMFLGILNLVTEWKTLSHQGQAAASFTGKF